MLLFSTEVDSKPLPPSVELGSSRLELRDEIEAIGIPSDDVGLTAIVFVLP